MSLSRFLRHGLRLVEFRLGHFPVGRMRHFRNYSHHYLRPSISCSFSSASEAKEDCNPETITVTFVDKDGSERVVKVPLGMSMLEAAHVNGIELEGACEGSLTCSTCHVIVTDVDYYNKLEDPIDDENDMLDLAIGLTQTSRLGCQIVATHELDGLRLALPSANQNFLW